MPDTANPPQRKNHSGKSESGKKSRLKTVSRLAFRRPSLFFDVFTGEVHAADCGKPNVETAVFPLGIVRDGFGKYVRPSENLLVMFVGICRLLSPVGKAGSADKARAVALGRVCRFVLKPASKCLGFSA